MVRNLLRWSVGVMVGFLALVGTGASATFYLREPANLGFLGFPTIVALHVVLGAVYLVFAPFQFVTRIRSRHLGYHRRMGRALVALSDGPSLRTEYLVGCDGGRSLIRKAAGVEFFGWDPTTSHLIAEVEMAEEPEWGLRRDALGIHSLSRMGDGGPVRHCDIL